MQVLHRCDVRCCVNPDHLFLGTNADNMADKTAKGRAARDLKNGLGKLTAMQKLEIAARRSRGERGVDIAREYGVTPQRVAQLFLHGH